MILGIFAALAALRILFVTHYRFDSDEPQHLHVVWGWTHGLVQYRDVFDNHTPLFHLASIPIFRWVGERADALIWMRLAMVPLFVLCLACIYRLGTLIQSRETGLWGAVLAALTPGLGFTFTEYRADDLWAALWLCSLAVLLGGSPSWRRGLIAGLLFGATLSTSLKTLALLGCLGAAALTALALERTWKTAFTSRKTYEMLFAIIAGGCVVPGLLALWFARLHALDDALYGIFTYNSVARLGRLRSLRAVILGSAEFVALLALLIPASAWMARRLIAPERRLRFHLVFLGSGFYGALIYTLWPLLDAEHLIPCHPLFALGLTPLLLHLAAPSTHPQCTSRRTAWLAAAAIAIGGVEAFLVRNNSTARQVSVYAELLRLSDPSDLVMDLKGESIFRQRPYRQVFEGVGIALAQREALPDDIPEKLIATHTCIAVRSNYRFTYLRTLAFMESNYLAVGKYRVLGNSMKNAGDGRFTFNVTIPETFAFVANGQVVKGLLDGNDCPGFAPLAAGPHEFIPTRRCSQIDFVWKRAIDRGFSPTHPVSKHLPDLSGYLPSI
ncbi:MAG: hypothetical protein P4L99_19320 [Chthoniobacter sp.]|nr:hypothetical protein [Chthoniobacter sp.]